MKKLLNFIRGTVVLQVTGVEPERLLNRCAKENIPFWAVRRSDTFEITLTFFRKDVKKVKELATRCQCEVERERFLGLPPFLLKFRYRYALMAGILIFVIAISVGNRFVFVLDVQGNEAVSSAEILSNLRKIGVKPGIYGPSINSREVSNQMLLLMDELTFFSCNLYGTRLEIIVREREKKPDLLAEAEITDVVSTATGIITHQEVLFGKALYGEGDTVVEGELLISGAVELQGGVGGGEDLGVSYVRAQGRVYARTWRTLTAVIPLESQVKDYTGEAMHRVSLNVMGKRVKFYGNGGISFPMYDKITETNTWMGKDGSQMPVSVEREVIREYTLQAVPLNETLAEEILTEALDNTLATLVGEEGKCSVGIMCCVKLMENWSSPYWPSAPNKLGRKCPMSSNLR